eukprot:TRINITY_DN7201_c0_g1_i16.p1 TRINITY_DN7201_c0_g1~~TRINITY_DN7201_c0_g1_i16.p1  ORF type:complete len:340 (+),score=93.27 TRINITY_DN7201_c0_g1_i16:167-1186(+)
MKLTMIGDFLLIPAKNKGLYLYRYNAESNLLEHAKTFLEGKNVRDITAKPGPITNKIAGYLCDPDKGIASYEIDIKTMEMRQSDYMKEFIGAKVVNWILYEGDNKLFTVLEGLRNSAKAIILSINLKNLTDMTYDSIKLVDGSPRYGNAGNQYTSVIMANSIFLMETNKKGDSMYRYFNIEGINHAKIYNRNSESWMIYATQDKIIGTYIFLQDGFLLCNVGRTIKNDEFSILGRSHICGADEFDVPIKSCYYKVDITLELALPYPIRADQYKVAGLVIIGISLVVVAVLLVFCVKLIKVVREAEKKLQGYKKTSLETEPKPEPGTGDSLKVKTGTVKV